MGTKHRIIQLFEEGLEKATTSCDHAKIADFAYGLGYVYFEYKEYNKAIEYNEKGLKSCTELSNSSKLAAKLYANMGRAYIQLKEHTKAIECSEKSLSLSDDKMVAAYSNRNLCRAYTYFRQYEKAISYHNLAMDASTAIGNREEITTNYSDLGLIYLKLEEHEKAIGIYKKNLRILDLHGDQSLLAYGYGNLGDGYLSSHQYKEAIEVYKKSLEKYTAIDNRLGMGNANCQLGLAYNRLEEFENAKECFEKMLEICTAIGYQKGISCANSNLGMLYLSLDENEKAKRHFQKVSLDELDPNDERTDVEVAFSDMGCAYMKSGEYEKAIDFFEKSLKLATAKKNRSTMRLINSNLSQVYGKIGGFKKSLEYMKESLKIANELGDPLLKARETRDLGDKYLTLRLYEEAIKCYESSLEIVQTIGTQRGKARGIGSLGLAYNRLEKYEMAIFYSKKCLEISSATGDRSLIAQINNILCEVYRKKGEYETAIECGKRSLEISTAIGDPGMIASAFRTLGDVYYFSGQYEIASTYLLESIESYDKQLLNAVPDQNTLSFTQSYFGAHRVLKSCFVSLNRIKSGLLVLDLGRAKELHLSIARKKNSLNADILGYASTIWDKIRNRQEQEEIERIQNILLVENNEIKSSIIVFAFDLKNSLIVWILNGDSTLSETASNANFETFLRLISVFSQRFNVNMNRDTSFFRLQQCDNLFSQINSPFELLGKNIEPKTMVENTPSKDDMNNKTILKELYKLLIEPVKDIFKGNKIIIVPDKQLFFVPFSSLIDENDCYLSQSYSIQITPSLHTLRFSMERSNDSDDPGFALFVGNPTVGKIFLNGSEFEQVNLPKAAEEVVSLSKHFAARPLVKGEAKKKFILGLLSGASIIHIAAHGEPKNGEIMLAPDLSANEPSSSFPNPDSYLLTQKDITSISLQARLVVLCCCHTGQGEISSEGVIGIARSFLAAGARSVLATLWGISDHATKDFMKAFYDELLQETPVCEALRRVMNLFQQHEREYYRSFLIWAPFTLYGEDVMFTKGDIETIREKSSEKLPECGFALFVGNPTSDLPKATEEVYSLSKLFKAKAFVEGEAKKQVLLGLLSGASIIHISSHIEPKQCAIMLSPCVSSNQASLTLAKQNDILTHQDVQGLSLKGGLVVLCLCHSEQDEISPAGVEVLALSFLAAGARSVFTTLRHSDDDATTEFIKAFYNHLLHESSVREALEKTKKLFEKRDEEAYRSFEGRSPFTIYGEDVIFKKHDVETIREKSREMFSGFVVLPSDELTGSFENLNLQDKP